MLTPITVRQDRARPDDYILVKGQGRTLACRMLGLKTIPAFVLGTDFTRKQKVQQFLVENVARLRMAPADRALLVARARLDGEETTSVARRFGISPATVRRLEQQLLGATRHEIVALQDGTLRLALQSVLARFSTPEDREDMAIALVGSSIPAARLLTLLEALSWQELNQLGSQYREERLALWEWLIHEVDWSIKSADTLTRLAVAFPMHLPDNVRMAQ